MISRVTIANKKVNSFPSPSNDQVIGFTKFYLVDAGRKERFQKKMNRQFEVLVWYPGEGVQDHPRKQYLKDHSLKNLSFLKYRFGKKFTEDHIWHMHTNSFVNLPVSEMRNQYPVLLFSHDLGMLPEYYSAYMEHLAAEGYFVFSINHPFLSEEYIINSDSRQRKTFTFKPSVGLQWALARFKARKLMKAKNYEEKWTISKKLISQWGILSDVHADMMEDRNFLLRFLEQLNCMIIRNQSPYHLFANRLDLACIGAVGHGWGGASSVHSLIKDKRIKAAVNLDGFQFCHAMNSTIINPLLMIYSGQYTGINEGIYFHAGEYHSYTVENARHSDFTDWPHFQREDQKSINRFVLYQTLNLTVNFFDKHIKKVDHHEFLNVSQK